MKRKKIIALTSGLGNQMFQYALALYLTQAKNKCIVYPFKKYLNQHNGLELSRLFNKKVNISPTSIFLDKYVALYFKLSPYISKLGQILKLKNPKSLFKILPYEVIVFPGWKNYTFIPEISDKIQSVFQFPQSSDPRTLDIIPDIKTSNSVSIHIRRGDYQNTPKWRCTLGDVCDLKYYQDAITYIKSKYKDCSFFVFSDDITWAKNNLDLGNARFIDWNIGENSYQDLFLMSLCKHNILSNSTFSLWGAWLNQNAEKRIIAPLKWHNEYNDETYKMYTDPKWILIDNRKPNISLLLNDPISENQILNILNQRYSDFEIITDQTFAKIPDARIKSAVKPSGNFIIHISDNEIDCFKDRNYLKSKLIDCYANS